MRDDLACADLLDGIRLKAATWVEGKFDFASADREYTELFQGRGLAVEGEDPEAVASRIRGSAIKAQLVAALDFWAIATKNPARRAWLMEVARRAEPGVWSDRFRDPAVWRKPAALAEMARKASVAELSPQVLTVLGMALRRARVDTLPLLRAARERHPRDFWLNFDLGNALLDAKKPEEAVGYYRVALVLWPETSAVYNNLGNALQAKGEVEGAIQCYQKAIAIDPKFARGHYNLGVALCHQKAIAADPKHANAHNNLGLALAGQKDVEGAIECDRKAIALDPKDANAHNNLGVALKRKGQVEEAIAEYKEAIAADPKHANAHNNLGVALAGQKDVEGAIASYRKAIAADPKHANAYNNLGAILCDVKRDYGGAIACFQNAIAADPKCALAHNNLGLALYGKKDVEGAIASYRKAIAIDPMFARAHHNLGYALKAKGDLDGAIACFRKAIALQPKFAEAHCNLGHALREQGSFPEALRYLEAGHQLGSRRTGWRYPSAAWVQRARRLVELDGKLLRVLSGKAKPRDAAERLALADLAQKPYKREYAFAARLYAEAFAAKGATADLLAQHRYNAACASALAAAGIGEGAAKLQDKERSRLRQQALDWLKADLVAWTKVAEGLAKRRPQVRQQLTYWRAAPNLAAVRDKAALDKLPEAERASWRKLWADVDALLKRVPVRNTRWTARLGSGNFARPVVAGGLVWVGTNNRHPRNPKLKGDAAVLTCFRETDGKFLWQYVSPRLKDSHQDYPGSSLNCCPLVEGERLYFTTNRWEVLCLDIAALRKGTGEPRQLWKLDMIKTLGVRPMGRGMNLGFTCSISSSYKGRIYVSTGNAADEQGRVPAPRAPSLLCLDKDTGKVLWSDSSPGKNIMSAQWSSPLLAEVKGRAQVIAAQGDGWLRAFDALTGKLLWKFDCNPKKATPYTPGGGGQRCFFIATPVLYENRVYIGVGQEAHDGPGVGHLWCVDITRKPKNKDLDLSPVGDNFDPRARVNKDSGLVWHYGGPLMRKPRDDEPEYVFGHTMSSVAIHDGLVIAPEVAGYIHCLDARTGRRYWVHDVEEYIHSSPLIAGGKVYVPTDSGLIVLALSPKEKVLARNQMDGVSSSPVFANGVLYLVAGSQLLAIKAGGPDKKASARSPGHWPQWRGPERTNRSKETGLLKTWPKHGPPLAWKAEGLGQGVASVAVAGGRVYTLGYRGEDELVTALQESTGKKVWSVRIGPAVRENMVMRWLGQRTPTVDGDRLYAVTARGELVCLKTAGGKEVWRKSYPKDFGGKAPGWGYSDRPLVDGDRLICAPGGATATVLALNKKTGATLWKCPLDDKLLAGYAATVVAEVGGVRHYVAFLHGAVVGVAARDGKLLWRYDRIANRTANNYTPIVHGDHVFLASGYGSGMALLKLAADRRAVRAEEVYFDRQPLPPWHEGTVLVGKHLYLGASRGFTCVEFKTGKVVWQQRGAVGGVVNLVFADGHLYLRSQQGKVALVEATPKAYRLKGTLQIPGARPKPGSTAPVVTGGRLYLRDDDVLFCYDVKEGPARKPGKKPDITPPKPEKSGGAKSPRRRRGPDAVFVPTPQDVVDRMLELARVKKTDVVYDLGCGDGRIVVTAARKYGCKAVGVDIDPECVRTSRENVKKHALGRLVTIEKKDLFTVNLRKADVVTLYLLPGMNKRLIPQLRKLKPGARVVAHAIPIPGVPADRVVTHTCKEDELEHKIYVWTAPLKVPRPGK
jgi:tetratricopeptide (TPR) repeat protein